MSCYSIGIIGGADGPTAVFVTGNPLPAILIGVAVLAAVVFLIRYFHSKK